MKNKIILLSVFSLLLISCKTDAKKNEDSSSSEKTYSIVPLTTKVGWTAYKTTDKVAVNGEFTEVTITSEKATTVKEVLNGLEFSIPVSSLFSNNDERDSKLKKFFFGVMENTELLSGKLEITEHNKGIATIKMNGVTNSFPIEYMKSGQMVTINGTLNIEDFNGNVAMESLNKVCFELHKGPDGISKTWSEVEINVATYLKVE